MKTLFIVKIYQVLEKYSPMALFLFQIIGNGYSKQTESSGVLKTATHRQLNSYVRKTSNIKHSLNLLTKRYSVLPSRIVNSRVRLYK